MDEILETYNEEIREKKQLARASKGKRTHNKTTSKNALRCDKMKPSELSAMSGDVTVYRLNSPMLWNEFKAMPKAYQEKYLSNLFKVYHVSSNDIASMFKVHGTTLRKYIRNAKYDTVKIDPSNRGHGPKRNLDAWYAFLDSNEEYVEQVRKLTTPKYFVKSKRALDIYNDIDQKQVFPDSSEFCRKLHSLTLEYQGSIDLELILKDLEFLNNCNVNGKLTISFSIDDK